MNKEKLMVNHLFDKGLRDYEAFRAYFFKSVGELQGIGVWD